MKYFSRGRKITTTIFAVTLQVAINILYISTRLLFTCCEGFRRKIDSAASALVYSDKSRFDEAHSAEQRAHDCGESRDKERHGGVVATISINLNKSSRRMITFSKDEIISDSFLNIIYTMPLDSSRSLLELYCGIQLVICKSKLLVSPSQASHTASTRNLKSYFCSRKVSETKAR